MCPPSINFVNGACKKTKVEGLVRRLVTLSVCVWPLFFYELCDGEPLKGSKATQASRVVTLCIAGWAESGTAITCGKAL